MAAMRRLIAWWRLSSELPHDAQDDPPLAFQQVQRLPGYLVRGFVAETLVEDRCSLSQFLIPSISSERSPA